MSGKQKSHDHIWFDWTCKQEVGGLSYTCRLCESFGHHLKQTCWFPCNQTKHIIALSLTVQRYIEDKTTMSSGYMLHCSVFHRLPFPSLPVNYGGLRIKTRNRLDHLLLCCFIWGREPSSSLWDELSGDLNCPRWASVEIWQSKMASKWEHNRV